MLVGAVSFTISYFSFVVAFALFLNIISDDQFYYDKVVYSWIIIMFPILIVFLTYLITFSPFGCENVHPEIKH